MPKSYAKPIPASTRGFSDFLDLRDTKTFGVKIAQKYKDKLAESYLQAYEYLRENPKATPAEIGTYLGNKGVDIHNKELFDRIMQYSIPAAQADNGIAPLHFPAKEYAERYLQANGYSPEEAQSTANTEFKHDNTLSEDVTDEIHASNLQKQAHEYQVNRDAEGTKAAKRSEPRSELGDIEKIPTNEGMDSQSTHGPKWAQQAKKAVLQAQIKLINQDHTKYEKERIARLSPKEIEARALHEGLNPSSPGNRKDLDLALESLRKQTGENSATTAANPYVEKANKSFQHLQKDLFGDIENAHEKSLYDQGMRNWEEKIAPSIKQKYLTRGVKGHGHVAKEVGEAAEKTMRGVNEAIIGQRAQNRQASIQAGAIEKEMAAKSAAIAGNNAKEDAAHNLEATRSLHDAHIADQAQRRGHAEILREQGKEDRDFNQREMDLNHSAWKEAENDQQDKLKVLSDMTSGLPTSTTTTGSGAAPVRPENTAGTSAAAALIGMGRGIVEKKFKKGGRIKKASGGLIQSKHLSLSTQIKLLDMIGKHKKLASGGQVDPNFIQEAVFAGVSPSTELKQQNRRQVLDNMQQEYENSRAKFADGGSVNPIAEGASMAKNFVDNDKEMKEREKALKMQVMSMREQAFAPTVEKERHPILSALDAGMAGAAATGNNDWIANAGKAWTGAAQNIDAKDQQKQAQQRERRKEMHAIAMQMAAEHESAQNHELAKKKMGLNEKLVNSQIGHYAAQNEALKGKEGQNNPESKTLNAAARKDKTVALDNIKTAMKMKRDIEAGRSIINRVDTGPITGTISNIPGIGKYVASAFSKGSVPERQKLGTIGGSLFLGAHQSMKNIPRSTEFAKKIEEIKLSPHNTRAANEESLNMTNEVANDTLATGTGQLEDLGYSPEEIQQILAKYSRSEGKTSAPETQSVNPGKQALISRRDELLRKQAGG